MKFSLSTFVFTFSLLICGYSYCQVELKAGTSIPLELTGPVNSKHVTSGQEIDLRVKYDVKVDDKVVVPAGGSAKGTVMRVQKAKAAGKPGFVEISAQSIVVNGQLIQLTGNPLLKEGDGKAALAWGLSVGGCFLVSPLSFFFLLIKGQEAEFAAGTGINATVPSNVTIK